VERNDEEELLRVVALRNAQSVLVARQRAEDELLRAKEALELKTEELAHSLALMRATLESTADGILAIDEVGKVTAFNENYVKMWRIPRELMDSRDHRQLLDLICHQFAEPAPFLARIAEISASMPQETFDLLELADGRVFERFSRIQVVDGRDVGRVWIFRDITERARMQKSETRLASLVETSNDAIISKSLDGIIQSWNPAAERLFGYTAEQAVGRHISLLIPADRAAEEDHIIARLRAGERIEHFDTVRVRSDGQTVQVSLTISPITDGAGRIVGASKIARDITERKRMEDELRQYTVALSEADRRKNDFLAMLAHELRNLLAPISTSLQMMRLKGANGQAVPSASEMIQRQVGHIERLVDD
jgi:PAS domain S-box-containing protein